ncbi:receptor-like protein Cf-9 [Lycium barbarum]|uniref:receptor-like protein Cf-9 n=1 Tax=Lycium barbarum TaxID=112863 RepID=UPI00293E4C75|nr:receptor-like protein Cf-9 [Lycium barbarum]
MGYEYLVFLLVSFFLCQLAFSSSVTHLCSRDESISLLKFKNTLTVDPSASYYWGYHYGPQSYPKTRSWNMSRDCCSWDGVVCDDFTGHVIELDLGCSQLEGKIDSNSSLFQLSHLRMLNLSWNNFSNSHISPEFDSNSLNGAIPSWVFSLPSLTELSLSNNHFSGQLEDFNSNTLEWIFLEHNQLQGPLPRSLQNLVNLIELDLSYNNFSGNVDVSFFSNLKQLRSLSLSYNSISLTNENKVKSTIPKYLESLFLSACEVKELDFLRSTEELSYLDLSNNKIQGRIPDWAWSNWMHMEYLNLSRNMLTSIDQIS